MTRQSPHHDRPHSGRGGNSVRRRRSFTLIELLITVSIIAIMASMVLFAVYSAQEQAKVMKTRALIAKLNNIVRARYDSYRTRRAPIAFTRAETRDPRLMAKMRLDILRDLMRMEMPDRWSDVVDDPVSPFERPQNIASPSANQAYRTKYFTLKANNPAHPTTEYQNAECLYLIVMEAVAREGDTRDAFRADDVADVDGDGMPEFIDAWGTPIRFLRWAPGFPSELQTVASGKPNPAPTAGATVEVEFDPAGFDTSAGNYLGGALAVFDPVLNRIDADRMATISGFFHTGAKAKFTCETVGGTAPFGGNTPTANETVLVLAPDPFDARGVYPMAPVRERATFALQPLVYSNGPELAGIAAEFDPGPLRYADPFAADPLLNLNPYYTPGPGELLIGSPLPADPTKGLDGTEWMDNIHNHALNLR